MIRKQLIILTSCILLILMILLFFINSNIIVNAIFIIAVFKIIVLDGVKYYKPSVAFVLPWTVLYIFQKMPITIYSRNIDFLTWKLITVPVLLSSIISSEFFNKQAQAFKTAFHINITRFNYALIVCYALFFSNVAYSRFIPLIQLVFTGDSGYMDYGIKGVNGLFYAYSNAFGLLCYYLYLQTREKRYLYYLGSIFMIFILCITRQNVISLVFEMLMVYTFQLKPINMKKILIYVGVIVFIFGVAGDLRSGDIKDIMGLKPQFFWIPMSFIWVYSYGFFNILNLDNLVHSKNFGIFDGSSTISLIPSFLRPEIVSTGNTLEVSNFTISSYINPIFQDFGYGGLIVFTAVAVFFTIKYYVKASTFKDFGSISIYAVLAFCAFFSFFVNFWFYLPIIFQIPFLYCFNKYLFKLNSISVSVIE